MLPLLTSARSAGMTTQERTSYASRIQLAATDAQESAIRTMIKDTNNDGLVSSGEAASYAMSLAMNKDKVDANHDGKVSFAEELNFALQQGKITQAEVDGLLKLDTNKDGTLSLAERRLPTASVGLTTNLRG
jgi:hypothetical protein